MKMTLNVCGTVKQIRAVLRTLADERLESNVCVFNGDVAYDYYFVDSDDLYSNDATRAVVSPNTEDQA